MTRKPKGWPKAKRRPRPGGKPKKATPGPYERWAAQWERSRAEHGGAHWIDKPNLQMDAAPFLATLRQLFYLSGGDRRWIDLRSELMRSDLIDGQGKWSRPGTALAHPLTAELCEMIEQAIAAGRSQRLVLAEAAAVFGVESATFDGAVNRLRRLLHAHRKAV